MNKETSTSRAITSLSSTLILLTFIVLKLTGTINWSWWWVLAPMWIPAVLVIVCLLILVIVAIVKALHD